MNTLSISKYEKIYTPLKIIVKKRKDDIKTTIFSVLNTQDKKIGKFSLSDDGYVSDLVIKRKFRRKKSSLDALFSIKDFVTKECKKRNLDYFSFFAKENNKHNLKRLYKHLGAQYIGNEDGYQFIGIINPSQKDKILEQIDTNNSLDYFNNFFSSIISMFK